MTLLKQHIRTHFICYAFIKALNCELTSHELNPPNIEGGVPTIILNSLDYIRRNVRNLLELCSIEEVSEFGNFKHFS
jgi:hypothetical protein